MNSDGLMGPRRIRYSSGMRFPHLVLVLLAGFLALDVAAKEKSAKPEKSAESAATARTAQESSLKQGMPAAEVLKVLGKPGAIEPMEAPTGKAEVWSYTTRQEISRERFEISSRPITTVTRDSTGNERTIVIGHEPIYGTQKRILVRTYQVLMFNDHFLNDKVVVEVVRETE